MHSITRKLFGLKVKYNLKKLCYPGLRPRLLIYKRAASTFSIHKKNADAAIYNLNVQDFRF